MSPGWEWRVEVVFTESSATFTEAEETVRGKVKALAKSNEVYRHLIDGLPDLKLGGMPEAPSVEFIDGDALNVYGIRILLKGKLDVPARVYCALNQLLKTVRENEDGEPSGYAAIAVKMYGPGTAEDWGPDREPTDKYMNCP
jgi:hypothetical protein